MDSALKWPGGKHYLAPKLWELARLVPHIHRVEVYGGSLAFTLATVPEGYSEVVNDKNGELSNFWRVLADPIKFVAFHRRVEATPFSESVWREIVARRQHDGPYDGRQRNGLDCSIVDACAFFVMCRQSLAGRMDNFATVSRTRTRRRMNEQVSAWLNAVEGLGDVHARLKRVLILNREALDVIDSQDNLQTLFYLDPPYVHDTRTTTHEYGQFEMIESDHKNLLRALASIKGKFLLSGYRSKLYDQSAKTFGWKRHDFHLPNNAAGGKTKRRMVECVWCNF